ncbi:LysR family transcriptional regulator substrate-binding protein [Bacillus haynesii]|nr:LysR family transcriptional regulator substrate-binding protein [Bacillus haynesii]
MDLTVTREECFEFIQMLELGEIDSAIVQDCSDHPNLFSRFLYEEEFQLVASKVHPLTKKETVELRECLKYPQVLPQKKSRLYNNILSELKEAGSLNDKVISVPYRQSSIMLLKVTA